VAVHWWDRERRRPRQRRRRLQLRSVVAGRSLTEL
jgi:hypothetical protein